MHQRAVPVPEDGAQPLSDSLIAKESSNIIVAGSDTTAMTLTYLVYAVLGNPDVKRKLLDELDTVSKDAGWQELESKPYLNKVITETLRWNPSIAGSLKRDTPSEGAVLAGYVIPGGTMVSTQAYTLHHDPVVWSDHDR